MEGSMLNPGLLSEVIDLMYQIGHTECQLFHLNEVGRVLLDNGGNTRYLAGRMLFLARQVRDKMDRVNELVAPHGLAVHWTGQGMFINIHISPASPQPGSTDGDRQSELDAQ